MRTLETRYEFPTYTTRAEWEARRRQLRAHLQVVLGLDPAWPAPPFDARYGELRSYQGFTVQPVWLQALPGFYVGGNLFRPRGGAGPRAAVLNPHGHAKNGRFHHGEDLATLRRCATLAKLGYVAYAWDMLAYGDTYQLPHIFESARAKLWGLTPLGVHVHNARRAFAFLASLPDVDPARIACTGESGGAGQTFFLAALEPRLAAAAPVCMISAHYQGGCRCEHAPGLRTDTYNVEIAAMFAPKPMLVVSTAGDWTCNTPEVELPDVRRIYALYGAADQLEGFHGPWPHNYNAPSRQAVYAWLRRVLPPGPSGGPSAPLPAESAADAAAAKPAEPPAPVAEPELSADEVASWRAERALLPAGLRAGDDLLAELIACRRTAAIGEPEETRRRLRHVLGLWRLSRPDVGGAEPAAHRAAAAERVLLVYAGAQTPALAALRDRLHEAGRSTDVLGLDGDAPGYGAHEDLLVEGFAESAAARQVQAIVAAWERRPGAALVAVGESGVWAAAAAPLLVGLRAVALDLDGFDPRRDEGYAKRFYVPGLRQCGGLDAALAACPAAGWCWGAPEDWPAPPGWTVRAGSLEPAALAAWLQHHAPV